MRTKNILLKTAGLLFLAGFIFVGHVSAATSTNTNQTTADARVTFLFGRIKQLNTDIFKYNSDPAKKNLTISLASERKSLVKELMKKNPRLFLSVAIKASQKSALSSSVQSYIEQETTLTSKIEVKHIDDFSNTKNSRFDYFLTSGGVKISYYPTQDLFLSSGAVIRTTGFKLDDVFVSDASKKNFTVTQKAPQPESVGDQKTLVILLDFLDSGPHPFTDDEAYNMVFQDQFQNFFKEQSYNQVFFSGEVIDWYKLNRSSQGGLCEGITQSELEKIVNERNINLANYKRLMFLPNKNAGGGWSSVGPGDWLINNNVYKLSNACIGLNGFNEDSWWGKQPFSWTNFDFVTSHEMGHSLGVWHANGWDCGDKTLYGVCAHREYGNSFDTMGDGYYTLHFNALYKEILGWIKPNRFLNVNRTGNYAINTLEKDSGAIFAKISTLDSSDTPYYLEYRRAWGFDSKFNEQTISSNQTGLFINNAIKNQEGVVYMSRLLDASPTGDFWDSDIAKTTLNANSVFDDPGSGITISNVSNATDNSINFTATLKTPSCVRQNPVIGVIGSPAQLNAGGSGLTYIDFFNEDSLSCGSSDFNVMVEMPNSWKYEISPPENISLAHGELGAKNIMFLPPANETPGFYEIKYDIINLTSGLKTSQIIDVQILEPLQITSITPSFGPKGTKTIINGEGFQYSNNTVFFTNDKLGWYVYSYYSFDGKSIDFTVPNEINLYGCEGDIDKCIIPTPDGVYDLQIFNGSASSNIVNFNVGNNATTTSNLKITKVTGPEKLKIGELGSWTIEATDDNNRPLSFSAIWGDEGITATGTPKGAPKFNPIATTGAILTHVYYISGKFQPLFIVKNDLGEQTSTTTAVYVERSDTSTPSITVLYPNGGEKWGQGIKQKITFQSSATSSPYWLDLYKGDAKTFWWVASVFIQDGTILTDSSGTTSRSWIVPTNVAPANDYFIRAMVQNKTDYTLKDDYSDNPFSITGTPGVLEATTTTSSSSFGNGLGAPQTSPTQSEKCNFYRDLTIGSKGADVSCLQRYLITEGFFPKNETATGYFGGITQSAVSKWQAKNYIAPASGYFGKISRNKYYSLTASGSYSSSSSLSFYPSSSSSSAPPSATTPSLAVISPKGGEIYKQGYFMNSTVKVISKKDNGMISWWLTNDSLGTKIFSGSAVHSASKKDTTSINFFINKNVISNPNYKIKVEWKSDDGLEKFVGYSENFSISSSPSSASSISSSSGAGSSSLSSATGTTASQSSSTSSSDSGFSSASSESSSSSATSGTAFSSSSSLASSANMMSSAASVTVAPPAVRKYYVTFLKNGSGKIFLTSSPGQDVSRSYSLYDKGLSFTVLAVPESGYIFSRWSGCGELSVTQTTYSDFDTCRVTIPDHDITLTAYFTAEPVKQTFSSSAPGSTTSSSPGSTSSAPAPGSTTSSSPGSTSSAPAPGSTTSSSPGSTSSAPAPGSNTSSSPGSTSSAPAPGSTTSSSPGSTSSAPAPGSTTSSSPGSTSSAPAPGSTYPAPVSKFLKLLLLRIDSQIANAFNSLGEKLKNLIK